MRRAEALENLLGAAQKEVALARNSVSGPLVIGVRPELWPA